MDILDENSEIGRHLKKAWETQEVEQPEKESFMVSRKLSNVITGKIILTHFKDFSDKIKYLNFQKNGILAIMGSDDIVRKAMAMADKEVSHQRRRRSAKDDKEYVLLTHVQMHSK